MVGIATLSVRVIVACAHASCKLRDSPVLARPATSHASCTLAGVDDTVRVERVEGEGWLISIRGEHDLSTAPMLSAQFDSLFESGAFIVADIREVTFLDSQVLGVFVSAINRASRRAMTDPTQRFALVVDVEQGHVKRLLDVAKTVIGDIRTYPSQDAALEALRAQQRG
jgi:anti-anti-sigma factor